MAELDPHVVNSRFRVYNRVAATKPLSGLVSLLRMGEEVEASVKTKNRQDDDDDSSPTAYMRVSIANHPKVFGIRVGTYFEISTHVLLVDAAIEYRFERELASFDEHVLRGFVHTTAAPRIAISSWTLIEELANTSGVKLETNIAFPPEMIAHAVLHRLETGNHLHAPKYRSD
ncbi:hypothetical protein [Mycobacteroides abscessus]|uniref:hypothetical protein n=1 Tax=Mycobacteroides abscessus TaxID=36809 RepID=UPI00092762FA|nr:hypothetical protein [Mycobacteroides abscessus]MDO3200605.1 hypothetical protein [Mycobacteroides abscessus subsp. abscessus]SHY19917.1 Uncharacterised protein [Mycobacteroides abscessus subsp. abscessus]SHY61086.1 Uncharacterised protein [Mycobacteroides abscessus subsp. abscessus]SIK85045.1 Uncharacterised protein [Mycobacteroides abscessus subsp. abscessus]SLC91115.1 Uncharacterised protein [Mycobacteroides abscessus subsp. abscessus]